MPRFFIDKKQISENIISIAGEDAHHISRSLRMAVGERITVSDNEGYEYECVLADFTDGCVKAEILDKNISLNEPPVRIHLFQALPKGEKLDLIIQKSVECGVYDITLFESERCIAKIKGDSEDRKTERRNKIALEAAKQCGRGIIPKVYSAVSFNKMLELASGSDAVLFCYEGRETLPLGKALKALKNNGAVSDLAVIIGSEGGFSAAEAAAAEQRGFHKIGLGKRILRTETASIMALSCLVYEFELS